jgi:SAM-dependent methyltransferase
MKKTPALKKIKNNLYFLSFIFFISAVLILFFAGKNNTRIYSIAAGILALSMLIRIGKVAIKAMREHMKGPWRFCKGKGIEIGSCGKHMVKGSILVDLVDDFSSEHPYKVDYVSDAHDLPKIEGSSLDYVCASHVLEHLTDPIKAISEWLRILKPGGILWLRIPDKRKTFDRNRERTKLSHLIDDFKKSVPVDDPTHVRDNNENTDPPRNGAHPYIHNHVWVPEDISELFDYINANRIPIETICVRESASKKAEDFCIVIRKRI